MKNYCGFIEIYSIKYKTYATDIAPYSLLLFALENTIESKLITIAIFKIKLK